MSDAPALHALTRRHFFRDCTLGVGKMALASLLAESALRADPASSGPRGPHFPPKAKSVIYLFMAGGPSQLDMYDYKPQLNKLDGQPIPQSIIEGKRFAFMDSSFNLKNTPKILGTTRKFARHGQCGAWVSELYPHVAKVVDDLTFLKTLTTEQVNHAPAKLFANTGSGLFGRPSMGAWITYGIGSESEDLPGFVVLISEINGRSPQPIAARQWHSGFLPGRFQGIAFQSKGDPVHYLNSPDGVTTGRQRDVIDAVEALNRVHDRAVGDPEISTRISQYEIAFRMQASVPGLMDISAEPRRVLQMYGAEPGRPSFASNCLLARRLAERGVRFIQLYHRDWDHHGDLVDYMKQCAESVDQATAALIRDLKQRGMLEETLLVWGGEFGRTPMGQGGKGSTLGRDHHMKGFSMWLTGGGVKGGISYGATDDLGYNAVENVVEVHDLHATMLHLLGIDHKRMTYKFQGRDFRLTDVRGNVVRPILA